MGFIWDLVDLVGFILQMMDFYGIYGVCHEKHLVITITSSQNWMDVSNLHWIQPFTGFRRLTGTVSMMFQVVNWHSSQIR